MSTSFLHSFQSEWLKTRRSLAAWLVIIGGFFLPFIMLVGRTVYHEKTSAESTSPLFWENLAGQCWQFMALFLLPMGVILATSLITQIEFRNNAWKQVHTTPQHFYTLFWSKLMVIMVMVVQFFILFNIGIYLAGAVPALLLGTVDYPSQPFPFMYMLKTSGRFMLDILPVVGLQYLISLQFKNFFVPLGVGIAMLMLSLVMVEWKYGYIVPYTYSPYNFFELRGSAMSGSKDVNIHWLALSYFAFFTVLSFVLYISKKEKG